MPLVDLRPFRPPLRPSATRGLAPSAACWATTHTRRLARQPGGATAAVASGLARAAFTAFTALATFTTFPAAASEPPEKEGLTCTATNLHTAGGLRLEVTFANTSAAPTTLPAGAHLALYRDAAATDVFEDTARVDRLQRTPLTVPANGRASALFIADAAQAEALLCRAARPAAAGLYFYEFSRRPTFRCVLKGEVIAAWPKKPACASPAAGRSQAPAQASQFAR